MPVDFSKYLAKSDGTTLEEHTIDVLQAGFRLVDTLCLSENDKKYWFQKIQRVAVLHDLGKIHKDFRGRLVKPQVKGLHTIRHEIISLWFCENFLNLPDDELFAIATHHKGVLDENENKRLTEFQLTSDVEELLKRDNLTVEILKEWLNLMKIDLPIIEKLDFDKEISPRFFKILTKKRQQKIISKQEDRFALAKMRGLLIASDHIGSAKIQKEIPSPKSLQIIDFQPNKEGVIYPFRQFQVDLQTWKGDVILHAPTGSGKTEAALSWVYSNQTPNCRVFYLLPYTASINAMVIRLKEIYGSEIVTALHSKSLDFFYDEAMEETSNHEESEDIAKNKKSFSKELFYPVKVATLHQVLKNSLMGKGWEMALFDYQNALFIFDEFHTYDPLITGMMMATVNWLRTNFNAKIMFMSATIPEFMLKKLVKHSFGENMDIIKRPNPLIISDAQVLDRKRHKLICKQGKAIENEIEAIEKNIQTGKFVLIIVNNVSSCQKLFKTFQKYNPVLLHGGLHREDRKTNEGLITNSKKENRPKLLIATQAVEVSLDIDYEVAFIENAPIDALIQRFGRVNRACKMDKCAEVHIFEKSIGNIEWIYDEKVCKDTFRELLNIDNQELTENDLVKICNVVYADGYIGDDKTNFEMGFCNPTINDFNEKLIAGHWEDWIETILEKSKSKIDVLCGNCFSKYVELVDKGKYIEANQLFVQIYFWESKEIQKVLKEKKYNPKFEKYNVLVADDLEYEEGFGFKTRTNSENQFL